MPQVVLDEESSKEHVINAQVLQDSIFGLTLFLLNINDLPCDVAWYNADDIVYFIWDEDSDLQQQLEFLNLVSSLRYRMDWG